jgi:hypothetical protein
MRYRLFTVGPPPHQAFFTMSDAIGQTPPDIQIIYAIICVNWAVTGMARYMEDGCFSGILLRDRGRASTETLNVSISANGCDKALYGFGFAVRYALMNLSVNWLTTSRISSKSFGIAAPTIFLYQVGA